MWFVFWFGSAGIFSQGSLGIPPSPGVAFAPWLVWVFFLWKSWTRDTRGEKRRTNLPQALWAQVPVGYEGDVPMHLLMYLFVKTSVFYEFHGTEAFLWCSNLTQAFGIVRGVCWWCCCTSPLPGLSWRVFLMCHKSPLNIFSDTVFYPFHRS